MLSIIMANLSFQPAYAAFPGSTTKGSTSIRATSPVSPQLPSQPKKAFLKKGDGQKTVSGVAAKKAQAANQVRKEREKFLGEPVKPKTPPSQKKQAGKTSQTASKEPKTKFPANPPTTSISGSGSKKPPSNNQTASALADSGAKKTVPESIISRIDSVDSAIVQAFSGSLLDSHINSLITQESQEALPAKRPLSEPTTRKKPLDVFRSRLMDLTPIKSASTEDVITPSRLSTSIVKKDDLVHSDKNNTEIQVEQTMSKPQAEDSRVTEVVSISLAQPFSSQARTATLKPLMSKTTATLSPSYIVVTPQPQLQLSETPITLPNPAQSDQSLGAKDRDISFEHSAEIISPMTSTSEWQMVSPAAPASSTASSAIEHNWQLLTPTQSLLPTSPTTPKSSATDDSPISLQAESDSITTDSTTTHITPAPEVRDEDGIDSPYSLSINSHASTSPVNESPSPSVNAEFQVGAKANVEPPHTPVIEPQPPTGSGTTTPKTLTDTEPQVAIVVDSDLPRSPLMEPEALSPVDGESSQAFALEEHEDLSAIAEHGGDSDQESEYSDTEAEQVASLMNIEIPPIDNADDHGILGLTEQPLLPERILADNPLSDQSLDLADIQHSKSETSSATSLPENQQEIAKTTPEVLATSANEAYKEEPKTLANQINLKQQWKNISRRSIDNALVAVTHHLKTRIDSRVGMSAGDSGINSGEEQTYIEKGLWVGSFFGHSKKGSSGDDAGYSGGVTGSTIGFDLTTDSHDLLGIAYSNVYSRFTFRDNYTKIKAQTNSVSLYGTQTFDNFVVLQGFFSYAKSKIKTITKISTLDQIKSANGKFNNNSSAVEADFGYHFNLKSGYAIIPTMGVKYTRSMDRSYNETGADDHNLRVLPSKEIEKVSGLFGTKILTPGFNAKQFSVKPIFNFMLEKPLQEKGHSTKIKLITNNEYFESSNDSKKTPISYHLGAGVAIRRNDVEVSANYNCHLEKKLVNHQTSIKLKIIF